MRFLDPRKSVVFFSIFVFSFYAFSNEIELNLGGLSTAPLGSSSSSDAIEPEMAPLGILEAITPPKESFELSIHLDSSNLHIAKPGEGLSQDGIYAQANNITTRLGVKGYKLNEALKSYELLKHKPGWIVGFELTTRFDPYIVQDFVEREALNMVDQGVMREIDRRKKAAIEAGQQEAERRLENVRQARLEGLDAEILASDRFEKEFQREVDRQRSIFTRAIPGQVEQTIASNPEFAPLLDLSQFEDAIDGLRIQEQSASGEQLILIQQQIATLRLELDGRRQQLEALREEITAQAFQQMEQQIAASSEQIRQGVKDEIRRVAIDQLDEELAKLTPDALADGREQAIAELRRLVEKRAQEIRNNITKYSDKITNEAKIHQVAIGLGRVLEDQKGMIYVRFGKIQIQSGPSKDSNGQSFIEALSGINSFSERGFGVDNTFGFNAGAVLKVDRDKFVNLDFYVFHNRIGSTDARSSLANQLALIPRSEEEFAELQDLTDFTRIDSALARVAVAWQPIRHKYVSSAEVFTVLGQYNGEAGVSFGGRINFNGCLSVGGSFFFNENSPVRASEGAAVQVSCKINWFTGFVRYEFAKGLIHNGEFLDELQRFVVGAQFELYKKCARGLTGKVCGASYATVAAIRDESTKNDITEKGWEGAVALRMQLSWQ